MSLEVIVLAAGKGTRMRSQLPKVLHKLGGRSLLDHVLIAANALNPDTVSVVFGHGGDRVRQSVDSEAMNWVFQAEQLGTGHAVKLAMPKVQDDAIVLIMYGDIPLISADTMTRLVACAREADSLAVLTVELDDAGQYGRIVRDKKNQLHSIVEAKDADAAVLAINEINTGFMAAPASRLKDWVSRLSASNSQAEYYLTDVAAMAVNDGLVVPTVEVDDHWQTEGVNSRLQLAELERVYQRRKAEALLLAGVTLADPARIDIRGDTEIGEDSYIDINVVFQGTNRIGRYVSIGPNCVLTDVTIGDGVTIHANCVIEQAQIANACNVGPFARIRPQTQLGEGARVGNFVETKKSTIGAGSKVNHLSYVGDSEIGSNVNIGAGVITCNYDGVNKHKTTIKDNAFIGSDSQLIAPVTVGEGAFIGSGTTLSKNAPDGELTLSRNPQRTVKGWQPPLKKST
jgi:bifunctional UDP-N-acetylglucosamine pyrophosphorylase / glucosamine-1-phosphate N-acetyltransferase